jgi:SP family sugar:H+ symporter-like MFS transporter
LFFVFAFVPETKGLSLEDVDEMYTHYTPGLAFMKKFSNKEAIEEMDAEAAQEKL